MAKKPVHTEPAKPARTASRPVRSAPEPVARRAATAPRAPEPAPRRPPPRVSAENDDDNDNEQQQQQQAGSGNGAAPARRQAMTTQVSGGAMLGAPPKHLLPRMEKDAGRGVSSDPADSLIPLIYILQDQSPQVLKRDPGYIEGAETGDIWLRNAPDPIVKGEEGFLFQPCFYDKGWVEWVPRKRGGGFVARHKALPSDAQEFVDEDNPNRKVYIRPNGNEVVETRYHTGRIWRGDSRMTFTIPFTSSGHTVSRGWQFQMNSTSLPNGGGIAPSWAVLYKLSTVQRSNASGDWFVFNVEQAGWVEDEDEYLAGEMLATAFDSGETTGYEDPESGVHSGSDTDAPGNDD